MASVPEAELTDEDRDLLVYLAQRQAVKAIKAAIAAVECYREIGTQFGWVDDIDEALTELRAARREVES